MLSLHAALKLLDAGTKIGLLIGGLFTGWQYLEAKRTARIERTFDFVESLDRGKGGDTAKARNAISAGLRSQPELRSLPTHGMPEAEAARVHAYIARGLMENSSGGKGLSAELDLVLDLFEKVQVCVEKDLCDADTAHAFLGDDARTLWANFHPYIKDQYPLMPKFGDGLRRFVGALSKEKSL